MRRGKFFSAIALVLMPAPIFAQTAAGMTGDAQTIIGVRMVDPGSLVIRNTRVKSANLADGRNITILCGEYNAKNRFGGYAGFKPFIYEPSLMRGVLSFGGSSTVDFMSSDGSNDFSPADASRPGADMAALEARLETVASFIRAYLPVCQSAS